MNGKSKGFASSGILVGRTPRTKRDQRFDQLKGHKVTMGKNVPHRAEGAVGDITVREVSSIGLRCYIKTDSGWLDMNSLIGTFRINWIGMTLANDWAANTASAEATVGTPQYCKDQNGFVHLRGGAIDGPSFSGAFSAAITTLPEGFRPTKTIYRLVTRTGLATTLQVVKVTNLGVVNVPSQRILDAGAALIWNASDSEVSVDTTVGVNLEGISFFAHQTKTSIAAGSTVPPPFQGNTI